MVLIKSCFCFAPEKVPVKVWEALVQSQVRFNRVPEKVPEKVWEALGGFGADPAEVFLALGLQHASERFVKIPRCGCWGSYFGILEQRKKKSSSFATDVLFPRYCSSC